MSLQDLKIDRAPKRPSRRRGNPWIGRGIVLAVIAGLGWLFWPPISRSLDRLTLPVVQTVRVTETHPASLGAVRGAAANGYIVAARRAALSADTPGRIIELRVTEGSVVAKDDVVARLFSDELEAAVDRARADLGSRAAQVESATARVDSARATKLTRERNREAAAAQLDDAKAARQLAETQLAREQQLLDEGISSQDQLDAQRERADRAKAQVTVMTARLRAAEASVTDADHLENVAKADLSVATAAVDIATAALKQSEATLSKTYVRAPFDGVVVLKDAEVGEVVSPNSQGGSNARGSVCTMVDLDSLEVQADVAERSLSRVSVGAPANIYLDAFPDRVYPGRVDRIWPTADRQKSTVEVRVAFDERDRDLRPDMSARVVFLEERVETDAAAPPRIVIPEECIVQIDGRSGAFVVERDSVRFVTLELGPRRGTRVTVEDGLTPGQDVVRKPPSHLQDGDRVRREDQQ